MSERWTHPEEGRFVRRPKLREYDKKGKNYCMNNVNSLNCYKASYWKYKQIFVLDALIYVSVRSNKLLVCYVKKRNMAGYLCLFNILMIETFFSALCPWVITSISLFISLGFFLSSCCLTRYITSGLLATACLSFVFATGMMSASVQLIACILPDEYLTNVLFAFDLSEPNQNKSNELDNEKGKRSSAITASKDLSQAICKIPQHMTHTWRNQTKNTKAIVTYIDISMRTSNLKICKYSQLPFGGGG